MTDKEPRILDILDSFFSDDVPDQKKITFRCEICNNKESVILLQCECGWSLNGCLPCSFARGNINRELEEHMSGCENLQRQIRISEACK